MIKIFIKAVFCTLLLTSTSSANPIKVITSINPLASLIKMIGQETVDIEVLAKGSSCIHHYHLRPSQITSITRADLVIFVDPKFDNFLEGKLKLDERKVISITKFHGIDFIKHHQYKKNYHIWNDINNAIDILRIVTTKLTEIKPENEKIYLNNFNKYKNILKNFRAELEKYGLNSYKKAKTALKISPADQAALAKQGKRLQEFQLRDDTYIFLVADSLEYFFNNMPLYPFTKLILPKDHLKFNDIRLFKLAIHDLEPRCILIDNEQSIETFKKLAPNTNILQYDGENWFDDKVKLEDLYIHKLKEFNNKIIKECS